jgi:hypothetical protein
MKTITSKIANRYLDVESEIATLYRFAPEKDGYVSVDHKKLKPLEAFLGYRPQT